MRQLIKRHIPIVLLFFWVALSFFVTMPWQTPVVEDEQPTFHTILLLSSPTEKLRSFAFDAELIDTSYTLARPQRLTVYLPKDSNTFQAGDVLVCLTQINKSRCYVPKRQALLVNHRDISTIGWTDRKLTFIALKIRDKIEEKLSSFPFSESQRALIFSLTLADRRFLSYDQRNAFADAGAMHILAVSGLHVGIIQSILIFIFTCGGLLFIPWEKKWLRYGQRFLIVAFVWLYAILIGMPTSVLRSAIMLTLVPIGRKIEPVLRYNRLALAALIILIIDPTAICSPSFLLSFSAVWAILFYVDRWNRFIPRPHESNRLLPAAGNKIYRYITSLLLVSLAAQIGTLPWTLYFFGQTANWFLLTNFIVIPLATILATCCFLGLLFSYLPGCSWVADLLMRAAGWAAEWMNSGVEWVQQLPASTTRLTFDVRMLVCLLVFILSLSAATRLTGKRRYIGFGLATLSAALFIGFYAIAIM